MNLNIQQFIKKLILFFIGLIVIQLGVALFLVINIGSDPFTVFTQGLSTFFNISVGTSNRLITLSLLIFFLIFDRKNINIGTLLAIIFAGIFLDYFVYIFTPIFPSNFNIFIKILCFLLSCLIIGFGFPILKSANLGVAPNDSLYLSLVDYLNKPYGLIRMATDSIFLILGFLLGGIVGLGTIICIICIGPIIQFFLPKVDNFVTKFILKN